MPNKAAILLEIGKRYEFIWPREKPAMRCVGTLESLDQPDGDLATAHLRYAAAKPPHQIIIAQATCREVGQSEPDAMQVRVHR